MINQDVFDIKGNFSFDELEDAMNYALNFIHPYITINMSKLYEAKLVGQGVKGDVVGDTRRAVLFLIFIKEEMIFDEKIGNRYHISHYIEKYETEAYRDYLVCRGVDEVIVNGLFGIFDLDNVPVYEEDIVPEDDEPIIGQGIGAMEIDGSNDESIFKIS